MVSVTPSRYTSEEISVWLRGLLTIAWADGHFDEEEKALITALTQEELVLQSELCTLEQISPDELAATLGKEPHKAENFLRTAVMLAIADGVYSQSEDALLQQFCLALGQQLTVLDSLRQIQYPEPSQEQNPASTLPTGRYVTEASRLEVLRPVKEWLEHLEVQDPSLAHFLCKMIPAQCPFERDVNLFGRTIAHIPPMCKLNPLYEQLVGLRFRAMSYLADDCGEDITRYC